ncbi:acetate/propionate family kinase [Pedobacter panaciterrae]|uniref:acetate/propionate family kinase n=1 Tax=Pedobacter panaciterrae TaxID=363849 RepID=UPI002593BF97|nr:acetate kinase [uncultured Pedobacter sp.]
MNILVINSGSSSLKYQLFKMPEKTPVSSGLVERIGEKGSAVPDHRVALQQVIAELSEGENAVIKSTHDITAVGHRVVHGGELFSAAVIIDEDVKRQIKKLFSLAPLHNPANYACIEVAEQTFPDAIQIAVFDTAFHQTIPENAYRYAIPESYYKEHGIRVYGFHGTSHKYVSEQAALWLKKPEAKLITIHLGNGCSMAAVNAGKSVDTTMGFGPLSGLMMGTRSGDIDPSVIFHLMEHSGYTLDQLSTLLNKQSGLLGVGGSGDMRDIRKRVAQGDEKAKLALELYAYRIKKFIGAYAAVLNGLDAIVFTAGVGENDADMRSSVCRNLDYLNIVLDENKNRQYKKVLTEINTEQSKVKILIIPTNEEYEIADQCYKLLNP